LLCLPSFRRQSLHATRDARIHLPLSQNKAWWFPGNKAVILLRPPLHRTEETLMMPTPRALANLERIKDHYGGASTAHKLALLRALDRARLRTANQVERLHEALCFLRAYPDDARVAGQVERMLVRFARRADLKTHRDALADSGIAGTTIHYCFFWPTARWLAQRWPGAFHLDRRDAEAEYNIAGALPMLVTPAEAQWLHTAQPASYDALDTLRGRTTDATFLVRAIDALAGDSFTRESLFDGLDPSCALRPGQDTPSRTLDRYAAAPAIFRSAPLRRNRPDLRAQIHRPPQAVRAIPARAGAHLIELARGVMITRQRDLDAFAYGDARDVRIVDDGDGLAFVLVGMLPERRTLLPAVYGILTLQNGVPIGYSQVDVLGGNAAISFNTFPSFRGGETAYTFARLLATVRHVLGATSFSIEPYQLGQGNDEGIETGAWWFYYKIGFRPRSAAARRIVHTELARMKANPRHRSSPGTLRKLAEWHLFFELEPAHPRSLPPVAALGERVAAQLARHPALDRAGALDAASRTLMRLAGLRSLRGFTPAERLAWRRWSPFVLALPGLTRWSAADRRAAARVVRAKGGRRESDFAMLFAAHARLARAFFALR
jgi:hypothetical protein